MSLVAVKSNFRCTYGTNLVDFPDKNTECMIILYIYIEIWKTSKITKMIKSCLGEKTKSTKGLTTQKRSHRCVQGEGKNHHKSHLMVNNFVSFQSKLCSVGVELLGWQSTHCNTIFMGRQSRPIFQNKLSTTVYCNTAAAGRVDLIKRQCGLQCNVTKSEIIWVKWAMPNLFFISKRALIVLMNNCFLS